MSTCRYYEVVIKDIGNPNLTIILNGDRIILYLIYSRNLINLRVFDGSLDHSNSDQTNPSLIVDLNSSSSSRGVYDQTLFNGFVSSQLNIVFSF